MVGKEKPILFFTHMIKAILDGRGTMTRQVIKPQPHKCIGSGCASENYFYDTATDNLYCKLCGNPQEYEVKTKSKHYAKTYSPRYKIGDILWVQESYGYLPIPDFDNPTLYYAASNNPALDGMKIQWCSMLFMPRKIARLFLRVTNVRTERLQDISEKDCIAEGVSPEPLGKCDYHDSCCNCDSYQYNSLGAGQGTITKDDNCCLRAKDIYIDLWNTQNAKRGYEWDTNPWVWVYEFERVEKSCLI